MQFKVFQIAAAILASLAFVSAVPTADVEARDVVPVGKTDEVSALGDVETEDFYVGTVWKGANKGGTSGGINVNAIPSSCYYYISSWDNTVTSIQVDSGIYCNFYLNTSCSGLYVRVSNGAYAPNLGGTNYDNSLSSYRCYAY